MQITGISWLGTRTSDYDAMVNFTRDVLGLTPTEVAPGLTAFALPDGSWFEVFGPLSDGLPFPDCAIAAFQVNDVVAARAQMELAGTEFIGPVFEIEDGWAWSYFRAPDGNVYEIAHNPDHRIPE
jgi:predicted enzyme related to lactoylglutathione lyase